MIMIYIKDNNLIGHKFWLETVNNNNITASDRDNRKYYKATKIALQITI